MNTLFTIMLSTTLLAACATTGRQFLPTSDSSTGVGFVIDTSAPASIDAAPSQFPALVGDASLPSAARHRQALLAIRDRFAVDVNVCVAPDGSTASAKLARSTGAAALDRSAEQDIARWRFEPYKAPMHVRVCKTLALAYHPAVAVGAR